MDEDIEDKVSVELVYLMKDRGLSLVQMIRTLAQCQAMVTASFAEMAMEQAKLEEMMH